MWRSAKSHFLIVCFILKHKILFFLFVLLKASKKKQVHHLMKKFANFLCFFGSNGFLLAEWPSSPSRYRPRFAADNDTVRPASANVFATFLAFVQMSVCTFQTTTHEFFDAPYNPNFWTLWIAQVLPPHSLQHLKDLLQTSWCQIPQQSFRSLVVSRTNYY